MYGMMFYDDILSRYLAVAQQNLHLSHRSHFMLRRLRKINKSVLRYSWLRCDCRYHKWPLAAYVTQFSSSCRARTMAIRFDNRREERSPRDRDRLTQCKWSSTCHIETSDSTECLKYIGMPQFKSYLLIFYIFLFCVFCSDTSGGSAWVDFLSHQWQWPMHTVGGLNEIIIYIHIDHPRCCRMNNILACSQFEFEINI